jgi:hypothetical protein
MTKQSWLLSAAVALATILVGMVLVLVLAPGQDESGDAAAAPKDRTGQHSSQPVGAGGSTTTTTTTVAPAAATTLPVTGPTVNPASPGSAATPASPVEPAFDQTDPPDPAYAYEPTALPPGVSSTITSCTWSPANGGEFSADGALTNAAGEDEDWLVSAVWLWHNVNQDEDITEQSTFIHAEVGQTTAWHVTIGAPDQPPNLSCALEID